MARAELIAGGEAPAAPGDRTRRTTIYDRPTRKEVVDSAPPLFEHPDIKPEPPEVPAAELELTSDQELRDIVEKEKARETPAREPKAVDDPDDDYDPKKLKRILWRIANGSDYSIPPNVKVQAAAALNRIIVEGDRRELGPGKPLTRAAAVMRLTNLIRAVGAQIALEAFETCFGKETASEATDQQAPAPGGTAPDAGEAGHEGGAPQASDLRTEHLSLDGRAGQETPGLEHNDLPGPPA